MRRSFLVLIPLMSGCWKTELVPLAGDVVHFDPQVGGPTDWVISELDLGLACPDGQSSAVFVVHPSSAPSSPLPVAVVYHSGPFDYVLEPNEVDPWPVPTSTSPPG